MMRSKSVLLGVVMLSAAQLALAQSPGAPKTGQTKQANPSVEDQIKEVRADLQRQIDDLKARLAARDVELEAMLTELKSTQTQVISSAGDLREISGSTHEREIPVGRVQASVADLATHSPAAASISQDRPNGITNEDGAAEQKEIRYKGLVIVPGGFLAAESIWRQRAMNADMFTNFNATPYTDSGEAHTSEWVPSARASRPSVFVSGKIPFGTVSGLFEGDFLSAGVTSNNLQSNSYTFRVRQAWAQVAVGHFKFTGGQMWSLLTENKTGADPGQEAVPLIFDANLHVGDSYIRQTGFRLSDQITPQITAAVSLENSQYQFSASNAPSNFFFGSAGATGGLNNSTANYTDQLAPDLIAKVSLDSRFGHYEIGGIARFFRDRYYASPVGTSAQNDTRLGGGFVANARFPLRRFADVGLHLVAGDGTGRYGVSLLPDITVRPNGTLAPIRNAQGLFSLELHPTRRLDLFGYAGSEYAQRTYYTGAAGTLVGYAPPSGNNSGCGTEAAPTAGTGYAPGASTCLGATRVITEGSAGWVYRIYSGPAGKLQYGIAYSYLTREGWAGLGSAPKATNNFVYTSFRYYIP